MVIIRLQIQLRPNRVFFLNAQRNGNWRTTIIIIKLRVIIIIKIIISRRKEGCWLETGRKRLEKEKGVLSKINPAAYKFPKCFLPKKEI
jgi:hypothetical protein